MSSFWEEKDVVVWVVHGKYCLQALRIMKKLESIDINAGIPNAKLFISENFRLIVENWKEMVKLKNATPSMDCSHCKK